MVVCGCGATISNADQAKRGHLKSDWHVQWERAQKTMRPLNDPKVKAVEDSNSSNTNRNSDNNNSSSSSSSSRIYKSGCMMTVIV